MSQNFGNIIICVLGFMLGFGVSWFAKRNGRGDGVRSDGEPVQQAAEQLERAERNQQETSAIIGEVADRVGDIQQRADRAETAAERVGQSLSELDGENQRAGAIIEECERMLESCGRRIQKGTEKN